MSNRLEDFEMTKVDFETGEKIDERHYVLIQDNENGELFASINTGTYNKRAREVLAERYSSGPFHLSNKCCRYNVFVANESKKSPIGDISREMLEKGFPKVVEFFNESKFFN